MFKRIFSRLFIMGNQTSKQNKDRSRKNVHWKSAGSFHSPFSNPEINLDVKAVSIFKENQTEKSKSFPFRKNFAVIFRLLNVFCFLKIFFCCFLSEFPSNNAKKRARFSLLICVGVTESCRTRFSFSSVLCIYKNE